MALRKELSALPRLRSDTHDSRKPSKSRSSLALFDHHPVETWVSIPRIAMVFGSGSFPMGSDFGSFSSGSQFGFSPLPEGPFSGPYIQELDCTSQVSFSAIRTSCVCSNHELASISLSHVDSIGKGSGPQRVQTFGVSSSLEKRRAILGPTHEYKGWERN